MSSLQSSEIASRRMSAGVRAKTFVPVVTASQYGGSAFVDFLTEQAQSKFGCRQVVDELQGIINKGQRLDSVLWQVFKIAKATARNNEALLNAYEQLFVS